MSLDSEADDVPDGQKAGNVGEVDEELTEAVHADDVDVEGGDPGEEEGEEEDEVRDGQSGQVDAARHPSQVGTAEDEEREDVPDHTEKDDDRKQVQVE